MVKRYPTTTKDFTDCNVLYPITSFCPKCHSYKFCWGNFEKSIGADKAKQMKEDAEKHREKLGLQFINAVEERGKK